MSTKSFVIFIIELGIVYDPGTASVSSLSGIIESAAFKSNLKILGVKCACACASQVHVPAPVNLFSILTPSRPLCAVTVNN